MLAEVELGFDTLLGEQAKPRRLLPVGSMRVWPELPVQVVQPVHFTVYCQCVPLDLLPAVKGV
jgi:hypothetical protein